MFRNLLVLSCHFTFYLQFPVSISGLSRKHDAAMRQAIQDCNCSSNQVIFFAEKDLQWKEVTVLVMYPWSVISALFSRWSLTVLLEVCSLAFALLIGSLKILQRFSDTSLCTYTVLVEESCIILSLHHLRMSWMICRCPYLLWVMWLPSQ